MASDKTRERAFKTYAVYQAKRDALGLSDYAVAQAAGITASSISDWKNGSYTPKYEKLAKIAAVINESADIFV